MNYYDLHASTKLFKMCNPFGDLQIILEKACEFMDTDLMAVKSKSRITDLKDTRHLYSRYSKDHTYKSSSKIGKIIFRDHATVLHSCKQVDNDYTLQKLYFKFCDFMLNEIETHQKNNINTLRTNVSN
jgi:hypothetical protein